MASFIFQKRWSRLPLAVEITIIVIIKLALLFVLWKLFFSEPQTKKMRMPSALVEQHFLTNRPASTLPPATKLTAPTDVTQAMPPAQSSSNSVSNSPSPTSEAPHDSH
ncbi:hypothetical protein QN379_23295 [Glaciimonas sp. Gout2]|uniref:cytochrome oxidase putative small subunit CydP n=1 Tax=unclassified Glaciimonas TaxID=2644401 RepID=UPI002B228556|nr:MULTISPECIES: cytochrome oxidase putative small subunit CydP [unclassified Glaciimonas]MEB0010164.1 hypothetical protein [Glaciimonas sp. Cout2]MEB0084936.1 hypothetical protein [Glaciimonas sp. Gout2]